MRIRPLPLFISLLALCVTAFALALAAGSVAIGVDELLAILFYQDTGMNSAIIWQLRLPRALVGFQVGAMLAIAGALLQVLLRNPLADPYILGVSGGAAVAALIAMWIGLGSALVSGFAGIGALFSVLLVFGLAHSRGAWSATRLLLTGVVVASGWSAIISFILTLSPEQNLRGMLFWLMGDLSYSSEPGWGLAVVFVGLAFAFYFARDLNLLARGELQASALGVHVVKIRIWIYLFASFLTAAAVTMAGSVGFIGLVVPHILRLLGAGDHRILIPAAALLGGSLLMFADTLARTLLNPVQLPVGVVTALLGVPVFLYLLQKSARNG